MALREPHTRDDAPEFGPFSAPRDDTFPVELVAVASIAIGLGLLGLLALGAAMSGLAS
ncbi:hypothetical protein [Methylopila sp. M107]|uniref:hypothetical protein n=1 Tax=Methylopila sp. M107 TaxID=1101190 RepID=UPI000361837F|nr:hypothetical protein [Methylopila sp. M107]